MKPRQLQWIFALLLATSFQNAGAQFSADYNFKFKTYTSKDGLVHNFTKKCVADRKGFLWIITQYGLSRFDGMHFKNFEHVYNDSASLPENDLQDIAIDKHNRVWLCYKTGMCWYDQAKQKFNGVSFNGKAFPFAALVYDSTLDCMWAANYTDYFKIDCASLKITDYPYEKPINTKLGIEQVFKDSKDRLWVLMDRRGYYTIDLKTNAQFYFDGDIWPMHVFEDEDHVFWMSTWASGFRKISFDGDKQQHTLYIDPFISKNDPYGEIFYGITENPLLTGKDILWITNSTQGVLLFDKKQEKFIKDLHYDPNIKNGIATEFNNLSYTDPSGILWFCTWHGLTKINAKEQQFNSRELPILQTRYYNRLAGIEDDPHDKNILWLGIEGSGLMKYDQLNKKILQRYFYTFGDEGMVQDKKNYEWRWIESTLADSRQNIWASTYGGLLKISNGAVSCKPMRMGDKDVNPREMIEYPAGTLWIASYRGLVNWNIATEKYTVFQPVDSGKNNTASGNLLEEVIKEDDYGLIAAGPGGAYEFDIRAGSFKKLQWFIKGMDSAGQQSCYTLQKINNIIYIGTSAGVVAYNTNDGSASRIGGKEGIDKVYDHRLRKDANDNLWIFTSHGLYQYDTHNQSIREYTTGDGIYDFNEDKIGFFEYHRLFYIGYRMAMTSFDPLSVNVNKVKSNPVITDMEVNNIPLAYNIDSFADNELQLSRLQNNINISFTCADFTNSDKITFAYRLDGYDKDWIYCGTERTATYANLQGGTYVFRVKACNSSGVWNEKEQQVRIQIATPFWQTIRFYILTALLVFFIAYLLYRYRLNRLVELYKIRDTISKNLHDEIGATLSSINIYSDVARKKNTGDADSGHLMERIYKASGQVMESMNDIVWFVNPKNDTWDNIIVRMREYAIPLLEAKNISASFQINETLLKQKLDMQQRQHVYFIFKEAINNIVKYASASKVDLSMYKKDKMLIMLIKDDGCGIHGPAINSGNGLANMKQRAEQMKGNLIIDSEEGKGTVVRLEIPIT